MKGDDPVEFVPLRDGESLIQEWGLYWESTNVGFLYWSEGSYLNFKAVRTLNGGETWEPFPWDQER